MKEPNNVIRLVDYIKQKKEFSPAPDLKPVNEIPDSILLARGCALLIDFACISLVKSTIDTGYKLFVNDNMSFLSSSAKYSLMQISMPTHIIVFLSLFIGYFLFSGFIFNGRTLGKKIMKLTTIDEGFVVDQQIVEHQITQHQVAYRSIGYTLCYLSFGTFFIFNFSSEDKRGLADFLSHSRTVKDDWLLKMIEQKEFSQEEISIDIRSLDHVA